MKGRETKAKTTTTKTDTGYSAPAVEQASRILFALADSTSKQLSLTDISHQVGISGSKTFGILRALEKSELVKRGSDGKGYCIGPGLVILSRKVLDDLIPSRVAEPVLDALSEESGSTSVFGLIAGDSVYIAAKRESGGDIRVVMRVGYVMPLTYGAHGKAIVPFLPQAEQDQILRQKDLYFHGDPDKLDRKLLAEEFSRCRREGFACALAQAVRGVAVVAAPVFGVTGLPIGVVETCVLASEKEARRFGPMVVRAAKTLSGQLGAHVNE